MILLRTENNIGFCDLYIDADILFCCLYSYIVKSHNFSFFYWLRHYKNSYFSINSPLIEFPLVQIRNKLY